MNILKLIFLLLAIVYGFANVGNTFRGNRVSGIQVSLMGIGIVGFVAIQFNLI